MIKVFVAIPSMGTLVDSQTFFLRALEEDYKDSVQLIYPKVLVRRMFHDYARNTLVSEFLESGADVMWFLDSDVTPPKDTLDLITKHYDKWQVAGITYPIFMTPPGEELPQVMFTAYTRSNGSFSPTGIVPDNGLAFVDGLATGCILIKREIFAEILPEKPYFKFSYKEDDMQMTEGEDFYFMRRLSDKGIKFFTDFSMVCKHQKSIDLLDVNNYAMTYAKKAVSAYHRALREELKGKISRPAPAKSTIILPNWSR